MIRNKCIEMCCVDPAHLFSAQGLVWQDNFLIVEKGIRGGISHAIYWRTEGNSKYMYGYDLNQELSYLMYQDLKNLCRWEIAYGWFWAKEKIHLILMKFS